LLRRWWGWGSLLRGAFGDDDIPVDTTAALMLVLFLCFIMFSMDRAKLTCC
jgi:hypothetical protein